MVVLVEVVILGSLGKFGCKVFKQLYLPSLWKMIKENHLSYCTGPLGIGFLKLPAGKGFAKMVTVWFKELLGRNVGEDKSSGDWWDSVHCPQWSPSGANP